MILPKTVLQTKHANLYSNAIVVNVNFHTGEYIVLTDFGNLLTIKSDEDLLYRYIPSYVDPRSVKYRIDEQIRNLEETKSKLNLK